MGKTTHHQFEILKFHEMWHVERNFSLKAKAPKQRRSLVNEKLEGTMQQRTFLLWVLSLNWKPPVTNNLLFGWIVCKDLVQKRRRLGASSNPGVLKMVPFQIQTRVRIFQIIFRVARSFHYRDFRAQSWKMLFVTFFGCFAEISLEAFSHLTFF